MSEEQKSPIKQLGSQPNPDPPERSVSPSPSLFLYGCLLIAAFILLATVFRLGTYDWTGFLLNLATDIMGAVIILLLVERRLRSSDIHLLQSLPETTRYAVTDLFSRDTKVVRNYVGVLVIHLRSVSRPFRLPRPHVEEELLKNRKQGLVLIGPLGTGKTTFMHFMVREQAKEVLEQPRAAQVPILVSATKWGEREAVDVLRTTMQSYYPVPDRTFTRLLKRGRLICFFDSLNEALTSDAFLAKLKTFHLEYPNNPLTLSTQPPGHSVIEDLAPIEIPSLTTSEAEELLRLRQRYNSE